MKRVMSSRKGASSILVILLLVVLVVFGIAALTTALSSLRLGQKAAEWGGEYYAVEAQAQQRYAQIDKAVYEAYDAGGDISANIEERLAVLEFGTLTDTQDGQLLITYETWQNELGISATLALDTGDKDSLKIVKWQQIQ